MLGQAFKPDSWEAEAGGFLCVPAGATFLPSHIGLHWESKSNGGYIVRSSLKQKKTLCRILVTCFLQVNFIKL